MPARGWESALSCIGRAYFLDGLQSLHACECLVALRFLPLLTAWLTGLPESGLWRLHGRCGTQNGFSIRCFAHSCMRMQPDVADATCAGFRRAAHPRMWMCSIPSRKSDMTLLTPLVLVAAAAALTACDRNKAPAPQMNPPASSSGANVPPAQTPAEPPSGAMPKPQSGTGNSRP